MVAGPGRRVALEDPTYPGAIDVYSRAGLRLLPLRADRAGTDPEALRSLLAREPVDVVHLSPQCASPTGTVTTPGRAEELAGTSTFGVVTARAVAPLERLARWCLPLVDPKGELIAMKGASARAEVEAARPALTALGCADPVVVELGVEVLAEPTWAVRLARPESGPVGWRGRPGRADGRARDRRRTQ